jgi:hypothetical protein
MRVRKPKTDSQLVAARGRYRRWYNAHPETQRVIALSHHGLTSEGYDFLLAAQGGACAICGSEPGDQVLQVDHSHACCPSKKSCGHCIRGLLCRACNTALGFLGDDPARLRTAIAYLETR